MANRRRVRVKLRNKVARNSPSLFSTRFVTFLSQCAATLRRGYALQPPEQIDPCKT